MRYLVCLVLVLMAVPVGADFVFYPLPEFAEPIVAGDQVDISVDMLMENTHVNPLHNPVSLVIVVEIPGIALYWPTFTTNYHEEKLYLYPMFTLTEPTEYRFQIIDLMEWPLGTGPGAFTVKCELKDRNGNRICSTRKTYYYQE